MKDKNIQNFEDSLITDYIRKRKKDVCRLIDRLMTEIANPDRIASAPLNQLSSVMGTLIDKFGAGEKDSSLEGTLSTLFDDFEDVS